MAVVLETTIGDFTIDLFTEERPRTCLNFLKLCKMKYYNHNLIYSIECGFIAQMGDPTGSGKGGESIYSFTHGSENRFYQGEKLPIMKHIERGTVSMVSCGDMLFGSQFFITLGENLDSLDDKHLVFGTVVEGSDALSLLNQTLIDETKRPYKDIRITHTIVLCDPFPDPEGLSFPNSSPPPTGDMFTSNYIAADEDFDEDKSKSIEEIREEIAAKEATARATILEMVGDIPHSEMAPPENVLFVCKLNPVTTSEDLEIIFSRFGKIICVEVIKDRITGNSLQYAFVEFSNCKSCEDAYFKMDNVLIDERRIHVDFSQSVSKIKWKGKGRVEYFDDSGKKVAQREYSIGSKPQRMLSDVSRSNPRTNDYDRRSKNQSIVNRNREVEKSKTDQDYGNFRSPKSSSSSSKSRKAKPKSSSSSSSSESDSNGSSSSSDSDDDGNKRKKIGKKKRKKSDSNERSRKERKKLIKQLKKELKKKRRKHKH